MLRRVTVLNFHPGDPRHARARDITKLTPEALCAELELGPVEHAVDVIVGGPPARLSPVSAAARNCARSTRTRRPAGTTRRRGSIMEYLHYVDAFEPLALLMENVPDVLNHGGQNIAEETCEVLRSKGYVCGLYVAKRLAYYGVPQMRERMILIAVPPRRLGIAVSFPEPTHCHVTAARLRAAVAGSR